MSETSYTYEEMERTLARMRKAGWRFEAGDMQPSGYGATFTKLIQTSRPGQPKRKVWISGQWSAEGLAEAVVVAAVNATTFEEETLRQAGLKK
jgi:hypothetical protein